MRLHAFVDGENVSVSTVKNGIKQLRLLNYIAKIDVFAKFKPSYVDNYNMNFVQCFYGKNSADTFMTAAIVKAVYEEPLIDGFAIFTSDSDFSPAIKVVTEAKKPVILVSEQGDLESHLKDVGVDLDYLTQFKFAHERAVAVHNNYLKCEIPKKEYNFAEMHDGSSVYIVTKDRTYEVPFMSGVDIDTFSRIIPLKAIKKSFPKSRKLSEILKLNYIKMVDNKLYIDVEGICSA